MALRVDKYRHALLSCRLAAGTIVAPVVGVEPIEHLRHAESAGLGDRLRVDLGLAEVAAVHRVRRISRVVDLVGLDQDVTGAQPVGELSCRLAFFGGQTWRDGGQGQGPRPECGDGLREKVARVDATREAHNRIVER